MSSWQSDPDSIPVAGGLPDSRFNKKPPKARQKQAVTREKLFGRAVHQLRDNTNDASVKPYATGTIASAGVERSLPPEPRAATPQVVTWHVVPYEAPETIPSKPALEIDPSPNINESVRGKTRTFSTQHHLARPPTPLASSFSEETGSSDNIPVPAWAHTLEHLSKDSFTNHALTTRPDLMQNQPTFPLCVSTAPHLRKSKANLNTTATKSSMQTKPLSSQAQERSTDQTFQTSEQVFVSASERAQTAKVRALSCVSCAHTLMQVRTYNIRNHCSRALSLEHLPYHRRPMNATFVSNLSASWRTRWIWRCA